METAVSLPLEISIHDALELKSDDRARQVSRQFACR